MFPSWWYLSGVSAQTYLGPLGNNVSYFCVGKRNPSLPEPQVGYVMMMMMMITIMILDCIPVVKV